MKYIVKQETKPTLSTFGKYKAVASHQQTIETRQILKEVCENNPIGEGEVTAVVWKLAQVIKRHLRKVTQVIAPTADSHAALYEGWRQAVGQLMK